MSEIAGIVAFDGAPISEATVRRMRARIEARGWHVHTRVQGSVALLRGDTSETSPASPPYADGSGDLLIAFDGRLDNRKELLPQLDVDRNAPDSHFAMAAYRRWGTSFAEHLLGDFAIGIVEASAPRLVCARDHLGVRRLHYRTGGGWIAFASAIDVLAAGIEPMPSVNEGMVGEYLSAFTVSVSDTVFTDIFRLPPAHRLVASRQSLRVDEYWAPRATTMRGGSDAELEEQLRSLLTTAVADRVRDQRAAAVMLSGGLDSSSVTGIAATLARQGGAPTVETISASVPGPDDERPYFEAVGRHWQITAHVIEEQRPRPRQFEDEIALDLEPQLFPHSPTVDAMRALVRQRGIRVLLTGMGADDWFGTSQCAYADLLAQGRVRDLIRRVRLDRSQDDQYEWFPAIFDAVGPLLPQSLRRSAKRALRRGRAPRWLNPGFARRIAIEDRMAQSHVPRRFHTHEQDANWFSGTNGIRLLTSELVTRGGDRFGLDVVHPFFDRRVVEFGLSLEAGQLWRDGRPKDLLRRAVSGFVPDVVRERQTSPAADHAFLHAIASVPGERPFSDLLVERLGWIDGTEVRARWAALQRDATRTSDARILWGILAVDLWLQARTMVK